MLLEPPHEEPVNVQIGGERRADVVVQRLLYANG